MLSAAKHPCSFLQVLEAKLTAGILRCAQNDRRRAHHDRPEFFHTFREGGKQAVHCDSVARIGSRLIK